MASDWPDEVVAMKAANDRGIEAIEPNCDPNCGADFVLVLGDGSRLLYYSGGYEGPDSWRLETD